MKNNIPRGASKSEPMHPSQLSAQKVLRDPRNALGDKFSTQRRYSLLNKRSDGQLLGERLNNGWRIELDDVPGDSNADTFTLISTFEG